MNRREFITVLVGAAAIALIAMRHPAQSQSGQAVAVVPIIDHWVKFTDPDEHAFQVDVPQNWKDSGGTTRRNALQFRNWLTAASPDGGTIVALGDPTEGSYIAPSPLLAAAGLREGSLYNGGGGTLYTVARYQTGEEFAVSWGLRKLASPCHAARADEHRRRPELAQAINKLRGPFGITHDVGEARVSCEMNGTQMKGYALVSTIYLGSGGIWYADSMIGLLAPAHLDGVAAGVLAHMVNSFQLDPSWLARTSQTAMEVSQIAARTNAAISDAIMKAWESRGAAIDRIMDQDSRVRLGIDIYVDPTTGTRYTVANQHNYYWVNPSGRVIGTDTDSAPAGYSRLKRVPPGR